MEKKFRVLRFVGSLAKIVAWIALVGGAIGGIVVFIAAIAGGSSYSNYYGSSNALSGALAGGAAGALSGLGIFLGALVSFVALYGAGEMIFLQLAIEENTRAVADAMKD